MIGIEKRLKNLELLDEAIDNEYDLWGNTPNDWETHLEILIAGGAIKDPFFDNNYSCPYVKLDGSICGNKCIRIEGCYIHWNKKNKGPGIPCKSESCRKSTRSKSGYCYKHNGGNQHKMSMACT